VASEFEAEIRNSMRSLQSAIEGVGRAQVKTTAEVARFGQVAGQAFKKPKSDADLLEEAAKKQGKTWRELGHAISKVGGPLGELAAKFGGGFGMEGGLSKIAVAAAAVGLAIKAVSFVLNKNTQDAKEAAEAWKKMTDAIEGAEEKGRAASLSGVGQAGGRRKVRAIGGEEGIEQLDQLVKAGVVTEDEGTAGISAIYGRFGRTAQARAAVNTARALAQTGVPFSHAASELAKGGSDTALPGVARQTAGRIFNDYYGAVQGGSDNFNQALVDTGGDKYIGNAARVSGVEAQTAEFRRGQVVSGEAETVARGQLADAKNPAAAAVLKVYDAYQKEAALLAKMAELQSNIAANFKDMGVMLGGDGSADYQGRAKDNRFAEGTQDITFAAPGG
jgi:hypothetical protein